MAASRLFRPASRVLSSCLSTFAKRPTFAPVYAQSALRVRSYATEGGVKETPTSR
ncbi:hypothetical protein PDE_00382 [Penicillium oxalicum 114-2]|uniref:Uncharacterized protein n=1 Tax=Penicillium oxalicum (strain 114-2 / CGMCC 5302) TaxID=933388 RepID=S7Z5Q7_PENO1|nr:hypothetical protein PDE_00382 [Penicillium oxalicum 114-2]